MLLRSIINRLSGILILLIVVSGCATSPAAYEAIDSPLPQFNPAAFDYSESPIDPEQLTRLSPEAEADFFRFFQDPKFARISRNERLGSYISVLMDQFKYSENTYTAAETLRHKSGNCLSLTLLTTALAELAGVELEFQLLNNDPVFSFDDDLLITSEHLRTVLLPSENTTDSSKTLFRSRVIIDYFDTGGMQYIGNIDASTQRSMYYSNRAIELIRKRRFSEAFAYAAQALELDRQNGAALNTMALLHRRQGDEESAERIFRYGLAHSDRALTFWRNYAEQLKAQGRVDEWERLLASPPQAENDHPWQWIKAARKAHTSNQYDRAVKLYDRALSLAPDLHQVHVYAAQVNYAVGNYRKSRSHLQQALALAEDAQDQKYYKGKLAKFDSLRSQPARIGQ